MTENKNKCKRKKRTKKVAKDKYVDVFAGDARRVAKVEAQPFDIPSIILKRIADLSTPVDKDVVLKFDEDGIFASNVDVINSSTLWVEANSEQYDFTGDEVALCIEGVRLDKSVKGIDKDDVSHITIGGGLILIETKGVVVRSPIYVDCRETPDNAYNVEELLPNSVTISSKYITRFLSVAKDESGYLGIGLEDGDMIIAITNDDNNIEDVSLRIPGDTMKIGKIQNDCMSYYSKEMCFPIFAALVKLSKGVTIHIGRDMPMYIHVKSKSTGLTANYVIAPRIDDTNF